MGDHGHELQSYSFQAPPPANTSHGQLIGEAARDHFIYVFSKGQCETGCYRFLAKHGGYVWVLTQATLIYSHEEANKAQCVVCISYLLSDIENPNEIVSEKQVSKEKIAPLVALPSSYPGEEYQYSSPLPSTNTIFAPRTEDMNKGFLMFLDDESGYTVLKEDEAEDLTHLAPTAGDVCIPLDVPNFTHDMFEDVLFPDTLSEPGLMSDFTPVAEDMSVCKRNMPLANDPFLSYRSDRLRSPTKPQGLPDRALCDKGCSSESSSSTGSPPALEVDDKMNDDSSQGSEITALGLNLASPAMMPDSSSSVDLEVDEMEFRAPYIPMGIGDDLPLLAPPDNLWGQTADSPPPPRRTTEPCRLSTKLPHPPVVGSLSKSNLARLLQSSEKRNEMQASLRPKHLQWKGGTVVGTDTRNCRERDKPLQEHSLQSGKDCCSDMNFLGITPNSGFEGGGREGGKLCGASPKQGQMSQNTKVLSCSSTPSAISPPQNARCSIAVHNSTMKPALATKRLFAVEEKSSKRVKVNVISAGETVCRKNICAPHSAINSGNSRSKDMFKDSVLLNLLISGQDISHGYSCVANKGDDQVVLPPTVSLLLGSTNGKRKKMHDVNLSSLLDPEGTTIPSLLDISPLDAEVNAPIQGTQNLLHGQDLLSALDTTLNAEVFL